MAFDFGVGAVHIVWMAAMLRRFQLRDLLRFGYSLRVYFFGEGTGRYEVDTSFVSDLTDKMGGAQDRMFKCCAIELNGMTQEFSRSVS